VHSSDLCRSRERRRDTSQPEFPRITIGITCFNAEDTIVRAINSAIKQDWPNKEIIVVDDASTDRSQALLHEIARQHPGLRVICHQANEGLAAALNRIVAESRGEFIAFFDDDDKSRQDRLTKQWRRLTSYERSHRAELVLCYSNREVVRVGQTTPDHVLMAIGRESPEPSGPIVANYLFGILADSHHVLGKLGSCTLMARRETFFALGDFDTNFRRCAEWDLAIRAALRGAHFIAVNEPLIVQFRTATADKSGRTPLECALKLRRKYKDYLVNEKAYLASLAIAHAQFHGWTGHYRRHYLFLALACGLLPPSILAAKLATRLVPIISRVSTASLELTKQVIPTFLSNVQMKKGIAIILDLRRV
jgi:glycosyltransferase involved in cell wall biosynthesis